MTLQEALKSITNYPIPQRTLDRVAAGRGLNLEAEADQSTLESGNYRLATADLMMWLVTAPNISEGGVSFSFSQEERNQFKKEAASILAELGAPKRSNFGYKGEHL